MAVKPEATYGLEETISRGQRDSSSQTARGSGESGRRQPGAEEQWRAVSRELSLQSMKSAGQRHDI